MSADLERVYTINLGKVLLSQSQHRAVRAINMIREFARHHMKVEEVKIEEDLAHQIWSKGVRSPPRKIRVRMNRTDEGHILVSRYDEEIEDAVTPEKETKQIEDKVEPEEASKIEETPKEEDKEEPPKVEPEETKEETPTVEPEETKEEPPKVEAEEPPKTEEAKEPETTEASSDDEKKEESKKKQDSK